jgi:dCTP deaminase
MKIGQIMFWKVYGDVDLYKGKYQSSDGPRESEVWRDFEAI